MCLSNEIIVLEEANFGRMQKCLSVEGFQGDLENSKNPKFVDCFSDVRWIIEPRCAGRRTCEVPTSKIKISTPCHVYLKHYLDVKFSCAKEEFCFFETFKPKCHQNEVIKIEKAWFGRINVGRCLYEEGKPKEANLRDESFIGCYVNIMETIEPVCAGNQQCNIPVATIKTETPCYAYLKHYLDVDYQCIRAKEFCNFETFKANCPASEIIIVKHAHFGRKKFGRCLQEDEETPAKENLENPQFLNCFSDVKDIIDEKCSGRSHCEVSVAKIRVRTSCYTYLKLYLDVEYSCTRAEEFCIFENFKPTCRSNEVIGIERADFGRKKFGRCLQEDEGTPSDDNLRDPSFINCYTDVKHIIDQECSGKSRCEVSVVKLRIKTLCHSYLKLYLDVHYSCLKEEYCNSETFKPECSHNEVIVIKEALFGRRKFGRCIQKDETLMTISGFIGCYADVKHLVDEKCSGLRKCEVVVAHIEFHGSSCPTSFVRYLEVSHVCLREEYCNSEIFSPQCGQSEIVVIEKAYFGRISVGRCLLEEGAPSLENLEDPKFIGCFADVKNILEEKCSGKRTCSVVVASLKVENTCYSFAIRYLDVKFRCYKEEFCLSETFKPECGKNEVVVIDDALFGRMDVGRCLLEEGAPSKENLKDFKFIGCYADVKEILDRSCSGSQKCNVPVVSFKVENTCYSYAMRYLDVKYRCLKEEYCQSETFQAQCPQNEIILLKNFLFGRMRWGRCLSAEGPIDDLFSKSSGYLACFVDVKNIFNEICAGRQACEMAVAKIDADSNCRKMFKNYLEAEYSCVREEYCNDDTFQPKCRQNEVIVIKDALFGRKSIGKCIKNEGTPDEYLSKLPRYVGCYVDARHLVVPKCSGKQECEVWVAKINIGTTCHKMFKSYLEVDYSCFKEEYCNADTFQPKCLQSEIVIIKEAIYGRKSIGKCIKNEGIPDEYFLKNSGYVGCFVDARHLVVPRCSGRRECEVPVAKIEMETACHKMFKSYLEVDYFCAKEEYCMSDVFQPRCRQNEIVVIKEAIYGRKSIGKCIKNEGIPDEYFSTRPGYVGCFVDARHLVIPRCSGNRECEILVAKIDIGTTCHKMFKSYLEVDYSCVKEEYCMSDVFRPRCHQSEIVVIKEAIYGRKSIGKCIKKEGSPDEYNLRNPGYVGCFVDARHLVVPRCSGRRECEIPVVKIEMETTCHKMFKSYLEVDYFCVKEEYCMSDVFQPKCQHNEIVVIKEAIYGRKSIGKCIKNEGIPDEYFLKSSGYVGCFVDARHLVVPRCSGRQECEIYVGKDDIATTCHKMFKSYLEVDYVCVKEEYCMSETFQPRCQQNEIIFIEEAVYGRMSIGKCIRKEGIPDKSFLNNPSYVGCFVDVKHLIVPECSGKKRCEISVAKIEIETTCYNMFRSYLEVEYTCVREEFCMSDTFQPQCPQNEIILIEMAHFGRKSIGRCLSDEGSIVESFKNDAGFVGCYADVKNFIDSKCAGRQICEILVAKITAVTKCHKLFQNYLDVSYRCVREEYCNSDTFKPHCHQNEVLYIKEAQYGRKHLGRCLSDEGEITKSFRNDPKYVGCYSDVRNIIEPECAGLRSCEIIVSKITTNTGCHKLFQNYLEAVHSCFKAQEFCYSETFQPKCPLSQVISIKTANFGRKKIGRCLENEGSIVESFKNYSGFVGCYADVRNILEPQCAGKNLCSVSVAIIDVETSCHKLFRYYLEVAYVCVGEEYCISDVFKPVCHQNEILQVVEAFYGRKKLGRCLSDAGVPDEHLLKTPGFVGCYADVRRIIEPLCAGRMRCEVAVAQIEVDTHCSKHFRYYLEAKHRCLKEEYCISETFRPRCSQNEIIIIKEALYGRKNIGRCLSHELTSDPSLLSYPGFVGCYKDVKKLISPKCAGKQNCEIFVVQIETDTTCPKHFKYYLEASYSCLKEEYCISETFKPKCHQSEVIMISEAYFGRKNFGRCLKMESPNPGDAYLTDPRFLGCFVNVKQFLDEKCVGKNDCSIAVVNIEIETTCHGFFKNYLEVEYKCLKEEFCNSEIFSPKCRQNEIILITEAYFGRKNFGRCLKMESPNPSKSFLNDPEFLGCYVDVKQLVVNTCSGKNVCKIPVALIGVTTPCHGFTKNYLEVEFSCLKEEYCNSETFRSKCNQNEMIIIKEAYFGRKDFGRCLRMESPNPGKTYMKDPKFLGCFVDVKKYLNDLCVGKTQCDVAVSNIEIETTCHGFFKNYLDVMHYCLKEEYCNSDTFKPRCRNNEIIFITEAKFSRERFGKCLSRNEVKNELYLNDEQFIGCYVDAKFYLNNFCTGKRDCEVSVAKIEFETPCHSYLKHYLEASYACIKDEYCHDEIFSPRCAGNEVIVIEMALFGRLVHGRCITREEPSETNLRDPKFIGCHTNVVDLLRSSCSGKQNCEVTITKLNAETNCYKYLKFYLEARYQCRTEEFCNDESFQPRCHQNEVLVIAKALYGRFKVGRCIFHEEPTKSNLEDEKFINCFTDVKTSVDANCSGKQLCEILVAKIGAQTTCYKYLKQYLEVEYKCVKEEYCFAESFQPRCQQNEVIVVEEAVFGRLSLGKCILPEEPSESNLEDKKFIGCFTDVKKVVADECSGKQKCDMPVAKIEAKTTCYKYLKHYLKATYQCIRAEDYCISEIFHPRCLRNEILIIEEALFSRRKFGRCLIDDENPNDPMMKNTDFIGCFADIKHILEPLCLGRESCSVMVASLKARTTCRSFLKHYLEVEYTCLKVVPETHDCKVSVVQEKQHISSAQVSNCGSKSRPWKISSMAGQHINITLLQLKSDSYDQQLPKKSLYFAKGNPHHGNPPCQVYAHIKEESSRQMVYVCYDGNFNDDNNYLTDNSLHYASSSNEVDVYFEQHDRNENRTTFLVSLEATGCSDLRPPEDATWNRTGSEVIVACHRSWIRWTLRCVGNKWAGVMGNCSYAPSYIENFEKIEKSFVTNQKDGSAGNDQMIMVFTIIIAGLVLCLFIACIGIVFLKRYYSMNKSKQMGQNPLYNGSVMQTANKAYYDAQQQRNNNNMMMMMTNNNNMIMTMDKQDEAYFAENSQLNPDTAQYFELDQALVGKEAPAMA
ncbi:hypothetical protein HELRODRAFT_189097 [Helobdella robusta]|uniref:SUEL-type lectin domain-containing protein n=1 Tax=Helobdella robusta TaxID=6412 RepID=T1FQM9_HELRO|nr:hypothetical protein HELRODRAFT_189097 [Helobdella robusta]ESN96075.1 hypothetical protein HELRODRAFT_189097 [Helobdella robusta]